MQNNIIRNKKIKEIVSQICSKTLTVAQLLQDSENLYHYWKRNNIFITENYANCHTIANDCQKAYNDGNIRALEGIPILLKDNFCTNGLLTTCGSKMLSNFVPDYDGEVVKKLREAGALIVGKANMDEFAMGSFGNYSYFKTCINPWSGDNRDYFAGGSSSGSAAAVAAGIVPVSLGTDTGGSVRLPAAWNGIVGFKPTYGAISRYGVIPLSSTLDTVSLFSRTVEDLEPVFEVLVGKDPKDASSIDLNQLSKNNPIVPKQRAAIIKQFNDCPDVLPSVYKVRDYLQSIGYVVEEIDVPEVNYCMSLYANIVPMEVMSNFAKYDGIRYGLSIENYGEDTDYCTAVRTEGFGEEAQRRIVGGAYMASKLHSKERCLRSYGVKRLIEDKFDNIFENYDFIIHPTSFSHAVAIEELGKIDPISIMKTDKYTVLANILGAPAISIPIDLYPNGMPIGVSLMANCLQDYYLLEIAKILDNHFKFSIVLQEKLMKKPL